MTEKQIVSVSLTEENVEWLDAQTNNRSAYLNDVIDEIREGGGSAAVIREFERRRLESQRKSIKAQLDTVTDQLEAIESMESKQEQQQNEVIERCVENWGRLPDRDSPGVETQAEKAGMEPDEFYEALKEAMNDA